MANSIEEYFLEVDDLLKTDFDFRLAKAASNWVTGPISAWLNENKLEMNDFPIIPELLRALICYVEFTDLISFSSASKKVFPEMITNPLEHPWDIMVRLDLIQSNDENGLIVLIEEVLNENKEKVIEYKNGKIGLFSMFIGQIMKKGKGKINPKQASELLKTMLDDKI